MTIIVLVTLIVCTLLGGMDYYINKITEIKDVGYQPMDTERIIYELEKIKAELERRRTDLKRKGH